MRNLVEVVWGDKKVLLNLDEWVKGRAYEEGEVVTDKDELDLHNIGPVTLSISEPQAATGFRELGRSGDPFAAVL